MALDHGNHFVVALVCRHFGFNGPTYTLMGSRVAGLHAVLVVHDLLLQGGPTLRWCSASMRNGAVLAISPLEGTVSWQTVG